MRLVREKEEVTREGKPVTEEKETRKVQFGREDWLLVFMVA